MSPLECLTLERELEERTTKFEIGELIVTPAVEATLADNRQDLATLVSRHQTGDWGEVSENLWDFNQRALEEHLNLQSVYSLENGRRVILSTNQQWGVTTVHLDHRAA